MKKLMIVGLFFVCSVSCTFALTTNKLGNDTYISANQVHDTHFKAKSYYTNGSIYLKQEKYREAMDSYYEAKKLFELANDKENAKKAEEAMNHAMEMRCEFGDYCQ